VENLRNEGVCTKFLTLCIKFSNPRISANPAPHPPRHTVILG
jgi:hypothetical protein